MNLTRDRIRDSAAGGAAFLVPLARVKAAGWTTEGVSKAEIMSRLQSQLVGREIDKELATVANALIRRMLVREFGIRDRQAMRMTLVKRGDSLDPKSAARDQIDHEIGNPPFFRLPGDDKRLQRDLFTEISSGRLNLYAMFVRRALAEVPPGGLVGYVIPASFLGGPEFESFRRRVSELSEVLVIDLIEKRTGVFLGAIQDTCFLVCGGGRPWLRGRGLLAPRAECSITTAGLLKTGQRKYEQMAHRGGCPGSCRISRQP